MKQVEQMQIPLLYYVTFVTSVINKDTKILSCHFQGKVKNLHF